MATVQALANGRLRDANVAINGALAETRQSQAQTRTALEQSEESRQQAEAVRTFLVEAFRSPDPSRDRLACSPKTGPANKGDSV